MNLIEKVAVARLIAKIAHHGQVDKAGKPYFTHPEKVASLLDKPEEKIVAYLHDTVEDTVVTIEDIREIFGDEIGDAVEAMTHAKDVPYMEYVKALADNPLALKVKLADLTHNMDLSRIENPTEKDLLRVEKKYKPAYEFLKGLKK